MRLRPFLGSVLVVGAVASLPVLSARAQLDPLDPDGLSPKPPAQTPPPAPPPAAAAPDAGVQKKLTPRDVERSVLDAQRKAGVAPPPERDPWTDIQTGTPTDKLGATLPEIPAFPVEEVLADLTIFENERLNVTGYVRRTCNTGCWVEIAESPRAAQAIRIIAPVEQWKFVPSERQRRVTAYGQLKKRKLDQKSARALDVEAGQKPASPARVEWYIEAEGAEVQWLD